MQDQLPTEAAEPLPPNNHSQSEEPLAAAPIDPGPSDDAADEVAPADQPPPADTPASPEESREQESRDDRDRREKGREPRGSRATRNERDNRGEQGGRSRPEMLSPAERGLRKFQACGRCSYFIADCQVKLGRETVQEAISRAHEGWLELRCDNDVLQLIHNAYGVETDVSAYYLDGTCPECRRRYTFIDNSAEEQPSLLRIVID
jgi:hypothetical protein